VRHPDNELSGPPGDIGGCHAHVCVSMLVCGKRGTDFCAYLQIKKGSRKDCVPGGQRTAIFSGSDWTLTRRPLLGPAAISQSQCFEATVGFLANGERFVVRRRVPRQDSPHADRSTWTIRCLIRYERACFRAHFVPRNSHSSRNVRRENMEIATAGQGVFSRNLPTNFHAAATRIRENSEAHAAHTSASSRAGNRRAVIRAFEPLSPRAARGYRPIRSSRARPQTG
jgi:hypothetical protein